ncbi:MAG: PQQ-binding-like beta-propeller repeat protein [Balneolaceae bacterium]
MRIRNLTLFTALFLLVSGCLTGENLQESPSSSDADWLEYQGGTDRNQYSALSQITPSNVDQLEVAWEYQTGIEGEMQTNPLIVDGILYGMTANLQPFALDAATGEEIWRREGKEVGNLSNSRGLVYWEKEGDQRILFTHEEWLYAADAVTGELVSSFGEGGRTSLKAGLGATAEDKFVVSTSPGTVYEDLIIMPLRVSEGYDAALGHIQAFNIQTGELEWVFHTIPHPGEYGYDTWPENAYKNQGGVGAANNWVGMSVDRARAIVYVPTGSAAFDFYGANRPGKNLFANTLLALDARTGERIWHFQAVHHDILDRDFSAPPNLVTITRNGEKTDAVAQVTKQGYTFVLDRETGEPLFHVEEKPVPDSDIPGEQAWPVQPVPVKPEPYARQTLTEEDINPYAENRDELIEIFRNSRFEGPFTPLSEQGTIIYPGLDGGAEWGGAAVDPDGIMYVNSNEMAWHISLGPSASEEELAGLTLGERVYTLNCSACHGADLQGNPASGFPSLGRIAERLAEDEVIRVISNGQGMMPAFNQISDEELEALVDYLFDKEGKGLDPSSVEADSSDRQASLPDGRYSISGYTKFLDSNGYPAIRPPWGTLNAIDLNTGEFVWKITYGEYPELTEKGIPQTGSESYGGPVVTASGLLFIAGTKDGKFRAYDRKDGTLLWETQLPAAAFATPATYQVDGKQYVVIACGGTKLGAGGGDSYIAFSLPD